MIKSFILKLVGDENAGRLDYLLRRKSKDAWGPLNGQTLRQGTYAEILRRINFKAIVETGTFRGTTTEFFARSGLPVYSAEIHPRAYGYARQRFARRQDQIHLFHGDSPAFLKNLAADPDFPKSSVFFYLDAHVQDGSGKKPPVVEELEIIFGTWSGAVVMIDDFEVPGTTYGHINYGPGKALNLSYLQPVKHLGFSAFFPDLDPAHEAGARRGWVVLATDDEFTNILRDIPGLSARSEMLAR